jgi:hypothetical protein
MSTIFLDECGYTGQNLLDLDQPIFTLASLNLSETDCQELKNTFFSNVQSTEIKYSYLSRESRPNYRQREMILGFLRELSQNPDSVKFSLAYKQFVLVTKIVEMLIEPVCYENGIDLYDRGGNIGFANLLFYTLPVFGGVDFFNTLLKNFQDMMRLRTKESYQTFFNQVFTKNASKELDGILNFFRESHLQFGYELLETKDHLNITVTCTLALMNFWRQEIDDDIILIHDNSSAMAKERAIWDAIVDPNLPSIKVGYDRRKMQFPIRVVRTCPEDSKNWAGLQLADILAGAFTRHARWLTEGENIDDKFGKSITEIIGDAFPCFLIAPEPKVTPNDLNTIGSNAFPLDYIESLLS